MSAGRLFAYFVVTAAPTTLAILVFASCSLSADCSGPGDVKALFGELRADAAKYFSKYPAGSFARVTGRVREVRLSRDGSGAVGLDTGTPQPAWCEFERVVNAEMQQLKKGECVTLRGKVRNERMAPWFVFCVRAN